ncbi:GroES-like protein [Polyporus arcularius HHB13444]|uniref:GroES-like protein n=1 Tax=Polyporus arcularius HHB13444 TaxID=1314778 RepID=A0A5C3NV16_9APHY|nr:GroES-like protein [Polyporus arcularius HHB13444]
MPTQKSLVLPAAQANWEVKVTDVPTPGPQDVLVKIAATALNPLDWKIQAFGLYVQKYPHIAGCEAAGTVEEVGGEVKNLAKGDKILFQGDFANTHATFQQYCIVPAARTSQIPDNISFDQAASVPLGLATVATGLWSHHPDAKSANWPAPWEQEGSTKFAGKPALILGGASSVGQYAIQLAKLSGHSPIITTASAHNAASLKSLGATHVLDRSRAPEDVLREIQKITGGTAIEYVYDPIATADTQVLAYDALAPGGTLILTLPPAIPEDKLKDGAGKRVIVVFGSVHAPFNRALGVELCSRLTDWLRTGVIVPNRVEVLPKGLVGISEGLERLKQGKVSGTKLVVRPQETP